MKLTIVLLVLGIAAGVQEKRELLRAGDRIVFFGDSLTELGVKPNGYVSLIKDSLSKKFRDIEIIGAGISGHRVPDLQNRVGQDVISKKPTIVVIYIGINDVWHFSLNGKGTPKELYRSGLEWLVDTLQATGASVILCTPSVIGEKRKGENPFDSMLNEYAEITRAVAREHSATLCDLRNAFLEHLTISNPLNRESGILTYDKVHLSDEGNRLVANFLLKILQ